MHLRTGNNFEYNVKNEYEVRHLARNFCADWRDGDDVLDKLWRDYLDTGHNDSETPDPVTLKEVIKFLREMEQANQGLPTFEKDRTQFNEFLHYVLDLEQLEKIRNDLKTALIRAERFYKQDYHREIQSIFREELDKFERNRT
ncbi:hypothetical protein EVB55_201 [Rhizobium phage RHph_Y68]|uniref:Uncharacterized protein n=1 Tax=Rhizobium phage RHph_Y68 TaxID=2509787 RepID=A0A7S5UTC5_9CAUD|nr:hypothetical protein PP934_gp201 [Rhizobium phage RHph_Y68]QIG68136.1 hypothetical protein EVB55_201 [Rhizobium phage RHph_Y68]